MKEYSISKPWKIFIYIGAPALVLLFGWVAILPFTDPGIDPQSAWFFIPLSFSLIVFMVLGLIDTSIGKVILDDHGVRTIGVMGKKQLQYEQIKGYRLNDRYIIIEPLQNDLKKIKITNYIADKEEIIEWLYLNYPDLDVLEAIDKQERILRNDDFGRTREERLSKLKHAGIAAKVLNWSTCLLAAWTFFRPVPYEPLILACMALPLVAITAFRFSGGLLAINDGEDKDVVPSVLLTIVVGSLILFIRALLDYNLLAYDNLLIVAGFISAGLLALVIAENRHFPFQQRKDYLAALGLLLVLFAYSCGSLVIVNCFYDRSNPEVADAVVIDKEVSDGGKSTTYYLHLSPFRQRPEAEQVSVPRELYEAVDIQDTVEVHAVAGLLGFPWFIVAEK
ncbi:MAG: hypothetical protein RI973_1730 [Bacteroidota bacterium]|jgi:hypothetical protein